MHLGSSSAFARAFGTSPPSSHAGAVRIRRSGPRGSMRSSPRSGRFQRNGSGLPGPESSVNGKPREGHRGKSASLPLNLGHVIEPEEVRSTSKSTHDKGGNRGKVRLLWTRVGGALSAPPGSERSDGIAFESASLASERKSFRVSDCARKGLDMSDYFAGRSI